MSDLIKILAQIERKTVDHTYRIKFKDFSNAIKEIEKIGFKELGIIENSVMGSLVNYVLVMVKKDLAIDLMLSSTGEITFGTLLNNCSVIDTGNYQGDQYLKDGKFIYKGFPGEDLKTIFDNHLKLIEESGKKGVSSHFENIDEWLKTVKITIQKFAEE